MRGLYIMEWLDSFLSSRKNEKLVFVAIFLVLFAGFLTRYQVMGYGVGSGGEYYYSQLVSLVIDGDIDIANQMQQVPSLEHKGSPFHYQRQITPYETKTGITSAPYALGPAILWMPFFILAHGIVLFLNFFGANFATNGFSIIHQIVTMAGSILYATIGLWLIYRFSSKFFKKSNALIATLAITFGFSVIQYTAVEPSISHALTLFTVPAFLYYFYINRNNNSWKKWAGLGLLGGLMMLNRWQEGFFFLIPLIYFIRDFVRKDAERGSLIGKGLAFLFVGFLVFSPQLIAWKILYGGFFTLPSEVPKIMSFASPQIFSYLFGFQHSLLISTPIILVSLFGAYYAYRKQKFFTLSLISTLLLFIYINSSLTEFGGNAFGARRFIDCALIFVLFLSALLERLDGTKYKKPLIALIVLLVAWNLIYFLQYNLNLINRSLAVTPTMLIENIPKIISKLLGYL